MVERELKLVSGWLGVLWEVVLLAAIFGLIVLGVQWQEPRLLWAVVPMAIVWGLCFNGFVVNGPNESRVIQLFGRYVGTLRDTGFYFGNPFYWRTRVTLR